LRDVLRLDFGPIEPLPGEAGGAIEQDIVGGEPAKARTGAAEVSDVFAERVAAQYRREWPNQGPVSAVAALDVRRAEIDFQPGDDSAELPVVAGLSPINRAFRPDAIDLRTGKSTKIRRRGKIVLLPAIAAVSAEIETRLRGNDRGRRLYQRKVGGECRTGQNHQ
jgi:hypothetical protein